MYVNLRSGPLHIYTLNAYIFNHKNKHFPLIYHTHTLVLRILINNWHAPDTNEIRLRQIKCHWINNAFCSPVILFNNILKSNPIKNLISTNEFSNWFSVNAFQKKWRLRIIWVVATSMMIKPTSNIQLSKDTTTTEGIPPTSP